jgi:membrane protein YqaA with SNARE-associated domain
LQFFDLIYTFAQQYGYLGVFFTSLLGAMTIIFPIPYTLIIYLMGGFLDPLFVAVAGGLGSAVGEFSGYVAGYYGRKIVSDKQQRKMDYMMKLFDRYGSLGIFLFALTPLPDDLLFIPLGIMRYKFLKAFIPCFLGKLLMSYILAYSGKHSIEFIRNILGEGGWVGVILTTAILMIIVFGMFKIDWEKIFKKYLAKAVKDD